MNQNLDPDYNPDKDPAIWGNDPISKFIDELVSGMPDRPPVAVVLINQNQTDDAAIINSMKQFANAYVGFRSIKVFDMMSYGTNLLAFYYDESANLGQFLDALSKLPVMESVVYVDGVARLRIEPVKRRPAG